MMINFVFTIKKLSGPLKRYVETKDTLGEIFCSLVTQYVRGSVGLAKLYNLRSLQQNYALDSGKSISNIEDFLKTTEVVQHLNIINNATD